jgi:GNAT superfamily N-acetyltransferase
MKASLKFEPITEDNFEVFFHLVQELAKFEKLKGPDDQAKLRLKTDGLSVNPKYEAFLGIHNGVAIGYIILYTTYSSFLALPSLFIEDLFILEAHRRKGFGQQFFKFCVHKAQAQGCGRIEWIVLTWNQPAINLYEKIGASRKDWYFYRLKQEDFPKILGMR